MIGMLKTPDSFLVGKGFAMDIQTDFVCPPIPDRRWDWQAMDGDNWEPNAPLGHGATEVEAIADLMEQIADAGPAG